MSTTKQPAAASASQVEQAIQDFVESVCELSKVNRLTGIWDNRRFQECKKPFSEVDSEYIYKTEKLSRKNVELRAFHRNRLEAAFELLIAQIGQR